MTVRKDSKNRVLDSMPKEEVLCSPSLCDKYLIMCGGLEGFTASGLDIARALKAELPDWTIVYCDEFRWQYQKELGLTPADCKYEV